MLHAFYQKHTKHLKIYHLVTAEPPLTVKTIEGMHHRQDLESCYLLSACSVLTKSVTVSVAVQKTGVVLGQA